MGGVQSTTGLVDPGMPTGVVKFFNPERGFGYITPDGGGKDLLVHSSDVRTPFGYRSPSNGETVRFESRYDANRGETSACNVYGDDGRSRERRRSLERSGDRSRERRRSLERRGGGSRERRRSLGRRPNQPKKPGNDGDPRHRGDVSRTVRPPAWGRPVHRPWDRCASTGSPKTSTARAPDGVAAERTGFPAPTLRPTSIAQSLKDSLPTLRPASLSK